MGSFSWLKADELTYTANILDGAVFKFLIPKEFGGGYIKDHYQDYGYLGHRCTGDQLINTHRFEPKYDMYELLAFWNADHPYKDGKVRDYLRFKGEFPQMKEIDDTTRHNRNIGIDIGCHPSQIRTLEYPLKLVSASFKGSYESCKGRSYNDPSQGWHKIDRRSDTYLKIRSDLGFDFASMEYYETLFS